jgi:hypothetical protein
LTAVPEIRRPRQRRVRALAAIAAGLAPCLIFGGCAAFDRKSPHPAVPERVTEMFEQAGIDQTTQLELEVERLRADLREAEEAMVAIESGLRDVHGRADAVSALAESRIAVERAARSVPWRGERVLEAKKKLEEAERQYQAGHSGSAIFFASRARRIARALNAEAKRVANTPGTHFINGRRVNLRAGPSREDRILHILVEATPVFPERRDGEWWLVRTTSGLAGWVHDSLLREDWSASSDTTTQSLPASFAR